MNAADEPRASAVARVPKAVLSRGVCGSRNRTLVVNLPGSPAAVPSRIQAYPAGGPTTWIPNYWLEGSLSVPSPVTITPVNGSTD